MVNPSDKTVKLTLLTEIKVPGDGRKDVQGLVKDYNTLDKTANEFSKRVARYFSTGEKAADDARKSVTEIQRALAKANDEATDPRAVQVTRARAAAFREELDEARSILDIQEQRVRVEEQINDVQDRRGRGGAAGGANRFESAGDVSTGLAAAGALLPGGAGDALRAGGDAFGLIEQLPRLSAGLAGLGVSVGAVLAVAAPLALAVAGVAYVMDRAEKANRAYIATEEELARLRVTGTSADAQAKLLEAQEELAIQQERIRDLYLRKFSQPVNLENFAATLTGSGGLDKALEEAQAKAEAAGYEIDALSRDLENGTFAARDAADAERKLTEERTRSTIAQIQAQTDLRIEIERLKATGTGQQVQDRLSAIALERDALERQRLELVKTVGTTEEGRAAIAALNTEIVKLNKEEQLLKDEVVGLVEAREREAAAIEQQKKAMELWTQKSDQLEQQQAQFNDAIRQLDEQTAERREQIVAQSAQRILDIEQKLADNISTAMRDAERADDEALRKLNDEIAAVGQEASDQEIELRQETADRINELEQRAASERQRILRDYNRAAASAIQDRDAVALDAARQTRDDALDDQERQLDEGVKEELEALKKRLEEQKRNNEQRLRDLRTSYEQEQRERQIALDQKLSDLQQGAANEINLARQSQANALAELSTAYNKQRQVIVNKFAEQFAEITGYYNNLSTLTSTRLGALYDQWQEYYDDLATAASAAQSESSSTGSSGGGSYTPKTGSPVPNARGTRNFRGGWSILGEEGRELAHLPRGTDVYSNRETERMLGGTNVTVGEGAIVINTRSSDSRGIMREVREQFPDMMADVVEKLNGRS